VEIFVEANLEIFLQALVDVDSISASKIFYDTRKDGEGFDLVRALIVPALEEIGLRWERDEVALSQVYMAGRICEDLLEEVMPLQSPQRIDQPRMGIAVLEDHHFLGKRIVISFLRASGYEIIDLGHQTLEELLESIKRHGLKIILVSALMLPAALKVAELTASLAQNGSDKVTVVVGGAPFRLDPELGEEVGADFVGADAADALKIISKLVEEES
jgi:trimethylamine corrinoid protein